MADELLHEPAMKKIKSSGFTAEKLSTGLRELAKAAEEMNADDTSMTFRFVADGEQVVTRYVPLITLRVRQPNAADG